MSIKVKLRENHKAIVKFTHPVDEQYFINIMRRERDSGMPHPKIILKNRDGGNIPSVKLPPKIEAALKAEPGIKK